MKKNKENRSLSILAGAISDVGAWTWWVDSLPEAVQLEFGWVMLYNPPKNETQKIYA